MAGNMFAALDEQENQFAATPADPSIVDRLQAASAGAVRGALGLPGQFVDAALNVRDLAAGAAGLPYQWAGGSMSSPGPAPNWASPVDRRKFVGSTDWLTQQAERVNPDLVNPRRPEDKASRYLMAAGMGIPSLALGKAQGMSNAANLTSSIGAPVAAQSMAEVAPNSPNAQLIAALAAQYAPTAAAGALRRAIRPSAKAMQENIQQYADAGSFPSVSQAANTPRMYGLENIIAKTPGAVKNYWDFYSRQNDNFDRRVNELAKILAGGRVPNVEKAGQSLQAGVTALKPELQANESAWRQQFEPAVAGMQSDLPNTRPALQAMQNIAPQSPDLSAILATPVIKKIAGTEIGRGPTAVNSPILDRAGKPFTSEQPPPQVGFNDVWEAKKAVSPYMAPRGQISGKNATQVQSEQLYGALKSDMDEMANRAGVGQQWQDYNRKYRQAVETKNELAQTYLEGKTPEQSFRQAQGDLAQNFSRFRELMKAIPGSDYRQFAGAMVERLGRMAPGMQNAEGDNFSMQTFLTNVNRINKDNPNALREMTGNQAVADGLSHIAKVAAKQREGSKIFQNTSGTAAATAGRQSLQDVTNAMLGGDAGYLAKTLGALGINNQASRLLTNQSFVSWLARSTSVKPAQAALFNGQLSAIASKIKDDKDKQAILQYINDLGAQ